MLPAKQLKDIGGITAIQLALNERLKNASPSSVVFSTVGATLMFAYVYSQITHRVSKHIKIQLFLSYQNDTEYNIVLIANLLFFSVSIFQQIEK